MTERRDSTSTDDNTDFSFAADNVERGEDGADFVKRYPKYPFGDDPRGREINFENESTDEAYGSTRNPVVRAYRGKAPLEGQDYTSPKRAGKLSSARDLRPELPNRSVSTAALDAAKEIERAALEVSNFEALSPTVVLTAPSPGATFSPGGQITIRAIVTDLSNIFSGSLEIDGQLVDRRVLDRRDQATREYQFIFIYDVPPSKALGSMDITVRGFNLASSAQGMIAEGGVDPDSPIDQAVGTLDGRLGQSDGTQAFPPLLEATGILRTAEGVTSITVNII